MIRQFAQIMEYPAILKLMNDCGFDKEMATELAFTLVRSVALSGGEGTTIQDLVYELKHRINIIQKFLSTD